MQGFTTFQHGRVYEIIYRQGITNSNVISSGRIPKNLGTFLQANGSVNHWRECSVNNNKINFIKASVPTGDDNNFIIPLYVIGYKIGLF